MREIILAAFLIASVPVHAAWIDKSGKSLPDTDARKANGDFGAHLVLVGDEGQLFDRWSTPSNTVDVATIDKVPVNGPVNAHIIFGGCTKDKKGLCDVGVRFRVTRPDGGVYAETPSMEVWREKPAPPGTSIELGVDYLKVIIEPRDPLGKYRVFARVRDNNSGVVLELEAPFTAVEGGK